MANHKSALKRARQSEDRRIRNRAVKTRIKNVIKGIRSSVAEEAKDTVAQDLNNAKSIIAKAAKKGIIHKRTAARKISRLAKHVNTLSA